VNISDIVLMYGCLFFPELAEVRTPINNLYLCGACCHPGGGIIGAPGVIAAEIIAEDHGLKKWWE